MSATSDAAQTLISADISPDVTEFAQDVLALVAERDRLTADLDAARRHVTEAENAFADADQRADRLAEALQHIRPYLANDNFDPLNEAVLAAVAQIDAVLAASSGGEA